MTDNTRKQGIAGVFDRAAPTYDQVGPAFFTHFGRRLVGVAGISSGSAVLDIASGRGAVLFAASDAVGPSGQVIGIDIAQAMVDATTKSATVHGLTNVSLRQMDAELLQFDDASFDAVLCGFAIFFFPRMDQALAEMWRVLKPGGRFAVSTWISPFGQEFDWLDRLMKEFLPQQQAPARDDAGQTPVFDTPEGLTAILASAGFVDIRITREAEGFVYANEAEWWASLWSHGMRGWLESVEQQHGAEMLQRFKDAAFAELSTHRHSDGFHQTSSALLAVASKPGYPKEQ